MTLTLSTRASRRLLFIALAVFIFLAYFSIRAARAAYAVDLNSRDGYERAVRLEPGNARYWYLLGRSYQYDFDQPDPNAALRAFLASRSLDPLSADTLLDLATNYDETGRVPEARAAYLEAKRVYPLSAEVLWRYGNFLLRQNEIDSAFSEIRRAVELDPKRGAEAFSRCRRVVADPNEVLDKAIPPIFESYMDILFDLARENQIDLTLEVWARANALSGEVRPGEIAVVAGALVQSDRSKDAALFWQQAAQKLPNPIPPDASGSVLWDGGFESGFSYGGLGWQFEPQIQSVQIALDKQEKHSGEQSLRIMFTGRTNISFTGVCHWVPVASGGAYQFSAWVKTKSLTTEQGVRFSLFSFVNGKGSTVSSTELHGDQPWTNITLPWNAPLGSHFLRVCAARSPSEQADGDIQGTAWIDDVSLTPLAPGRKAR
jgi:tetratricopeptide (TPR) repeat protein